MNPFNKNPFVNNTDTRIVGNNINFNEKQKLENIKEKMTKLKFQKPQEVPKEDSKIPNVKDKIDNLKNLDKWK